MHSIYGVCDDFVLVSMYLWFVLALLVCPISAESATNSSRIQAVTKRQETVDLVNPAFHEFRLSSTTEFKYKACSANPKKFKQKQGLLRGLGGSRTEFYHPPALRGQTDAIRLPYRLPGPCSLAIIGTDQFEAVGLSLDQWQDHEGILMSDLPRSKSCPPITILSLDLVVALNSVQDASITKREPSANIVQHNGCGFGLFLWPEHQREDLKLIKYLGSTRDQLKAENSRRVDPQPQIQRRPSTPGPDLAPSRKRPYPDSNNPGDSGHGASGSMRSNLKYADPYNRGESMLPGNPNVLKPLTTCSGQPETGVYCEGAPTVERDKIRRLER